MADPRFERLSDPGGDALEIWPAIDAKHVANGTPVQRGRMVLDDTAAGLSAGIWDCTAWTGTLGPYSVHEFMIILEGAVTIVDAKGGETTIKAGESFVIPKGLVCIWKQTGYVRKFFVIFDDASGAEQPDELKVLKLDTNAALSASDGPDPELVVSERMPDWADHAVHADPTGQWSVGLWSSTPYERKSIPFPRHELMHILEGVVTLTHGDGTAETYQAGDTVFVPKGAEIAWKNATPVRKIYCIMAPRAAAVAPAAAA